MKTVLLELLWLMRYGDKWFDFDRKRMRLQFVRTYYDGPHVALWVGPFGVGISA